MKVLVFVGIAEPLKAQNGSDSHNGCRVGTHVNM